MYFTPLRWRLRAVRLGKALITLFVLTGLATVSGPAACADLTQPQRDFLAAEKALAKGDGDNYRALRAKLEDYPLFPYLEADEARASGNPDRIQAFLQKYDDTPFGYDLRRIQLKQRAAKKDWKGFLAFWKETNNTEMQCFHLQALLGTGQKDLAYKLGAKIWLRGDSLPDTCDPVFENMQKAGKLTSQLVWDRIDLLRDGDSAKRTGLMKYLRRFLPKADQPWHDLWMLSLTKPDKVLASGLLNRDHLSRGNLLVHAINKLGWRNHDAALSAWHKANKRNWLNPAQKKRIELGLGKALSQRKSPRATTFFDKVQHCRQIADLCELRAEHALKVKRWDKLVTWIEQMPQNLQHHEKWGYWKARALEQLGRKKEAEALFREVAGDRSYYGFMAADRVGVPYKLDHQPVPRAYVERVAVLPGFVRARELYQLGRKYEAGREWHWGTQSLDREGRMGAARLAKNWGWQERALFTLLGTDYWDDLEIRFPLEHRKLVEREAKQNGIDTAWVFAIIRQESMFLPNSRSPVGALGLMQIMPATAKGVARRLKLKAPSEAELMQPELNIRLGSSYMKTLHGQFNGWEFLATPSYNAGPQRTINWLPAQPKPVDLWIEDIPFNETRLYVQRVMSYLVLYEYRLGQQVTRLNKRMPAMVSKALLQKGKPAATKNPKKEKPKGFIDL